MRATKLLLTAAILVTAGCERSKWKDNPDDLAKLSASAQVVVLAEFPLILFAVAALTLAGHGISVKIRHRHKHEKSERQPLPPA